MIRSAVAFLFLLSYVALASFSAAAYIGPVGAPGPVGPQVKASNLPPANKNNQAEANAADTETDATSDATAPQRTPLLVIRFNQQHVYFDRALRQAIEASEKTKSGVMYDVVSMVPAGGSDSQTQRINANAADNLNAVVQEMQSLGVQSSRMDIATKNASDSAGQEVDIFVR